MDNLPIFVNLRQRNCLIVGGGEVATRKAALLLEAAACVTVVSPTLAGSLRELVMEGKITHIEESFHPRQLEQIRLVIAATNDRETNEAVYHAAEARGILVNVVDNLELCGFIMPAIIDRSPVQIAVSTGGASPVLARLIRAKLEATIPNGYGKLAALVEKFREQVIARFSNVNARRNFWEQILGGDIAELSFAGRHEEAEAQLAAAISAGGEDQVGEVYLIGGGPGDPDLLTFRALRLMQQADVIVHDRLISKAVLDLTRRDAHRIYVGKERDNHSVPQEEINQLLVDLAKQGKRVCRLKGGAPFIFGRGGEEIETLAANGVNFQVVPGVTAALGSSAYAGIPLTHRDHSQAVIFVTGHLKDGSMNLNWGALAQPHQTIVFYMGLRGLEIICQQLISHGLPKETPIALIQQATTPKQRVFTGTLCTISEVINSEKIKPPTLIIVGTVVNLHQQLNWFRSQAMIDHGEV
ncbi:MAG: uroporphyrinogen-III C-methyltransferase [Gammaproteobacteria bacterium]|nr:uroporphyrinogen-III C-methyltransferase [Gammaproteobacteria bacterium]